MLTRHMQTFKRRHRDQDTDTKPYIRTEAHAICVYICKVHFPRCHDHSFAFYKVGCSHFSTSRTCVFSHVMCMMYVYIFPQFCVIPVVARDVSSLQFWKRCLKISLCYFRHLNCSCCCYHGIQAFVWDHHHVQTMLRLQESLCL
jgi:hypothetical protein